jgi:hypothetical protein
MEYYKQANQHGYNGNLLGREILQSTFIRHFPIGIIFIKAFERGNRMDTPARMPHKV